jgi:hypothetical protein
MANEQYIWGQEEKILEASTVVRETRDSLVVTAKINEGCDIPHRNSWGTLMTNALHLYKSLERLFETARKLNLIEIGENDYCPCCGRTHDGRERS